MWSSSTGFCIVTARRASFWPAPATTYTNSCVIFQIAEDDQGRAVGCCALHICWKDLAEVRSLAVLRTLAAGAGEPKLVESCLSEALTLGFVQVFTLTYRPGFFNRLGFAEVEKSRLPHKVWADCVNCVSFPDCDEIAMLLEL